MNELALVEELNERVELLESFERLCYGAIKNGLDYETVLSVIEETKLELLKKLVRSWR